MEPLPRAPARGVERSEFAAIIGGWTLVAILFAAHNYISNAAEGRPVTLLQAAWWSAAEWYTWALLTPLVIRLVRRVRAGERWRPVTLAALAAGGLIIAALQVGLEYIADHLVVLLTGDPSVSVGVWLSGGGQRTSSTHVANLAHAVELALTRGRGGEAYFVCDDGERTGTADPT